MHILNRIKERIILISQIYDPLLLLGIGIVIVAVIVAIIVFLWPSLSKLRPLPPEDEPTITIETPIPVLEDQSPLEATDSADEGEKLLPTTATEISENEVTQTPAEVALETEPSRCSDIKSYEVVSGEGERLKFVTWKPTMEIILELRNDGQCAWTPEYHVQVILSAVTESCVDELLLTAKPANDILQNDEESFTFSFSSSEHIPRCGLGIYQGKLSMLDRNGQHFPSANSNDYLLNLMIGEGVISGQLWTFVFDSPMVDVKVFLTYGTEEPACTQRNKFSGNQPDIMSTPFVYDVLTDENGSYEFAGLAPGKYCVFITDYNNSNIYEYADSNAHLKLESASGTSMWDDGGYFVVVESNLATNEGIERDFSWDYFR